MSVRELARSLLPPIVAEWLGRAGLTRNRWSDAHASWADAVHASSGYDAALILERVQAAALKVKRGEAVYERDSVLFDEIQYSWPLLAVLMAAAARNGGRLRVLDFGGALGSSYFQNRRFLDAVPDCRWSVVEQPHFVAAGRARFADERLRFHDSIEECLGDGAPDVALLSSVLQYLEHPYELLDRLRAFPCVVIDLTPVRAGADDRVTVQTVPPTIYPARYPCWIFSETRLRAELERRFEIVSAFEPEPTVTLPFGDELARYRGYVLAPKGRP